MFIRSKFKENAGSLINKDVCSKIIKSTYDMYDEKYEDIQFFFHGNKDYGAYWRYKLKKDRDEEFESIFKQIKPDLRPVKVSKWEYKNGKSTKIYIGNGVFHSWGYESGEVEGIGNYSTAIIEMDNGEIKNTPVELIQFYDKK